MKFLSPEFALYLNKSTIQPHMEYCCHVWAGASSCSLDMLYELQKPVCRNVGSTPSPSLEQLDDCRNVANESLLYRYIWTDRTGSASFFSWKVPLILWDCMIFSSPFLDFIRMSISTVPFLAQLDFGFLCLQNAFLLTYDPISLKSIVNRHLLSIGSF